MEVICQVGKRLLVYEIELYCTLTLPIPVGYQHPISPYITHKDKTFGNKKMRIDQTEQTTED